MRINEKKANSARERDEILDFLRRQPLALQRADPRVVHAYWDSGALDELKGEEGPAEAHHKHRALIESKLSDAVYSVDRSLAMQNQNPVKVVTSGPEVRAPDPFFAGGKERIEARHPWWNDYRQGPFTVWGHYWRIPIPQLSKDDGLFSGQPLYNALGAGNATCIDYSVGGRFCDRDEGRINGPYTGRLAALRWPERTLVFVDGECQPMVTPKSLPVESAG